MGPILPEPKPEDPFLTPPAELEPILDILNHALLEPFGISHRCQSTEDTQLFLSRLQRAKSWRLSMEPGHPVRSLVFRASPEEPNQIWITRENLLEAEELARAKSQLENGEGEPECLE